MAAKRRRRDRALVDAVLLGDLGQARVLLDQHGGPDPIDREHGETALMLAASFGRRDVVELLLKAGANVQARDNYGRTPLMFAATGEIARLLLAVGADADSQDLTGRSALMAAANADIARSLLDHGADVHMRDEDGQTALMYAVERVDPDLISILLSAGADPNAEDSSGRTVYSIVEDHGFRFLDDILNPKPA